VSKVNVIAGSMKVGEWEDGILTAFKIHPAYDLLLLYSWGCLQALGREAAKLKRTVWAWPLDVPQGHFLAVVRGADELAVKGHATWGVVRRGDVFEMGTATDFVRLQDMERGDVSGG